jgi:hypothetical protein
MPIKCAGAPQKAMYLSCDWWQKQGVLKDIEVAFCSAGGVLFGVADFVPPLMQYVERYGARLDFNHTLTAVDGPGHKAWFKQVDAEGKASLVEKDFDLLHVVPPQRAPEFIRQRPTMKPCATRASAISSASAMCAPRPMPRPPRRCASRRRWWPRTSSRCLPAVVRARSTMAMAPAR